MPLFISAKDRVANDFTDPSSTDLRTAFLQIERYVQLLENKLGITISGGSTVASDVVIGGLVGSGSVPASSTPVTNTTTTLGTVPFRFFGGHIYLCYIYGAGTVTVAVPTFVNITAVGSPVAFPAGPSWFVVSQNSPPVTSTISGTEVVLLSPSTNTNEVITVQAQSLGATATWTVPAHGVQIYMVRVA